MIHNPDWFKSKEKPYFHQISLDCIEKLVECMKSMEMSVTSRLKNWRTNPPKGLAPARAGTDGDKLVT